MCFAAVSLAWPYLMPIYNQIVVGPARVVFSIVEQPNVTQIEARGAEILVYRRDSTRDEPKLFQGFTPYVYVAFVPLVALLLATPNLGWLKRGKLTVLGLIVLASFHVAYVVAAVRFGYAAYGLTEVTGAKWYLYDWAQIVFRIMWDIIAIFIWTVLTFNSWRGLLKSLAPSAT